MTFEAREAELGLLFTQMLNEPKDRHEIYLQIRKSLAEMKACGMPLPQDLVQFESDLEAEFAADLEQDQARRGRLATVMARRGVPPDKAP